MYRASYKVPGGKLVKVEVEMSEGKISHVQFTGDFFLHPENALLEIESLIRGAPVDLDTIEDMIQDYVDSHDVQMIGCTARDFAHVIIEATNA